MPATLPTDLETDAIKLIRGLAMDAPLHAKSGHQGTAMALAPLGHVLYSRVMRHHPTDPEWPDRDRFVLSNGHASILQYSLLYLSGYGLELDDLRAFRSFGSRTPGHPEAGHTPGIEATTGPLGQGFANAVGMAIAERFLRARFGTGLVDHHTWAIAGDGCLMEGISHEAASLAGHLGLGRLNVVFDDNRITIDGPTQLATTDDVGQRFEAYGWHVEYLGEIADDCDALEEALLAAKAVEDRPSLLILRSHVGSPSPKWTDHHEAHGNPFTAEDVTATKAVLGIPDEPFWLPPDVVESYRETAAERCAADYERWQKSLDAIDAEEPRRVGCGLARDRRRRLGRRPAVVRAGREGGHPPGDRQGPRGVRRLVPRTGVRRRRPHRQYRHEAPRRRATDRRDTGWAADLLRRPRHAMGSTMVGMARHGGILPVGGTFFVFLDYMRPPVRLAALSRAKVVFVFTHDSVGVGEDGPTHQPVEHVATLRAIPGLQVIRPADANETVEAWKAAVGHDGPTALVLSRQGIPVCTDGAAVGRGAGIVRDTDGPPQLVIVATGSEVAVAIEAAEQLGADGPATESSACRRGTAWRCKLPASATNCSRRAFRCCPSRRPRRSVGSDSPTTRSASIASAPALPVTWSSTSWASTSTTSCDEPGRSL